MQIAKHFLFYTDLIFTVREFYKSLNVSQNLLNSVEICSDIVLLYVCEFGHFYRQACAYRSHAGIVFTQWSKNGFFAPQGRHVAPINVKFCTGEVCSPMPNFSFIGAKKFIQHSYQYSPKTVKISNFGQKFVPQGRLVCNIFTKFLAFVRVYRKLSSF